MGGDCHAQQLGCVPGLNAFVVAINVVGDEGEICTRDQINNGAFLLHLGAEWNPMKYLFVRGGLDQNASGFNLALGLGTKYRGFSFDYAYHTYAELSEFTTHYFSLGYIGE